MEILNFQKILVVVNKRVQPLWSNIWLEHSVSETWLLADVVSSWKYLDFAGDRIVWYPAASLYFEPYISSRINTEFEQTLTLWGGKKFHPFNSACWVIFQAVIAVCWLFEKIFLKNYFSNTIRVSNGLDPDQDWCSVGPDLGPNCLQRLLTEDKSCH